MERTRRSVLVVLCLLFSAGMAHAQITPDYTENPEYYRDLLALEREAEWLLEAWTNPVEVMKEQVEKVKAWNEAGRPEENSEDIPEAIRYLNLQDYEVSRRAVHSESAIRAMLAPVIVELARWDPIFKIILEIASPTNTDRIEAIQSLQLLVDAISGLEGDYPAAYKAAADILTERTRDKRAGVLFVVMRGIAALPSEYRSDQMKNWLIEQVSGSDEVLVTQAARTLADIGAVEAVRPLMEKFLSLEEGRDPATPEEEETSAVPINQTRLALATAIERLTDVDLALSRQIDRASLMAKYQELVDWWKANENRYN